MTPEGRRCHCPESQGYELSEDGVSCVIPEAFLLYTQERHLGRLSLRAENNRNQYVLPLDQVGNTSALDIDTSDGR